MDNLFEDMSTDLLRSGYEIRFRATGYSMQPTTPIDLTSRGAKWLHAARACAAPVTRWLRE
jgi:hypothetical protein